MLGGRLKSVNRVETIFTELYFSCRTHEPTIFEGGGIDTREESMKQLYNLRGADSIVQFFPIRIERLRVSNT